MSNLSELLPSGGAGKSGSFVASGAITAGQPVGLNPDGTISAGLVAGSVGAIATASASAYKTAVRTAYDLGNKAALILAETSANQLAFYYATFSGSTVTFSSETIVTTSNVGLFDIDYDSDTGYFAVVYNAGGAVYSKIGQISGGTVTFGSQTTIDTVGNYANISYNKAAKCMVVWYYDASGYPSVYWFSIGSTGGLSKTGTKTIVQTIFGYTSSAIYNPDTKTTMLGLAQNSPNIMYVLSAAPGVGQNVPTQIAWQEAVGLTASGEQKMSYNPSTKTLVSVVGSGSPANHYASSCQTNTYGANLISGAYTSVGLRAYESSVYCDEDANEFIFLDQDWNGTQDSSFYSYETYNGVLSSLIGTRNSFSSNVYDKIDSVYIPDAKQGFVAFTDDNDGDKLKGVLISPTCVRPVIGIAASSISDGAAGGVTLTGGIAEGLSGLTPGQVYYAQSAGSLGTDPYPPAKPVGRALSATTLNIGDV